MMTDKSQGRESRRGEAVYAPFGEEYRGFDARDDEKGRGPLVLALAIGVLLVFGAVVWNAYRQGVRETGELPLIAAERTPIKHAPSDPKSADVEDTETVIRAYDQFDGNTRNDEVNLADVREEVTDLPDLDAQDADSGLGGPPVDLRPAIPGDRQAGIPGTNELADLSRVPEVEDVTNVNAYNATQEFDVDPSGTFLIQVMALRSEAEANTAWAKFKEEHSEILSGARSDIQRADLGARGVFYRLRIAAFGNRPEADRFCEALKERNQDCIIVTR